MPINKEIQNLVWSAIERFSVQFLRFILTIILARLVSPNEYGLIAMLTIFIQIAQTFVDSGFSSALIQKTNRTEVDFSTCFYFNVLFSIIIYCILFITSPFIAAFYKEPILGIITKVIGLNIIITSLCIVQRTKLTIELNFKKQTQITLLATILSGSIGIYLAYHKYGVWALVYESIFNNLFLAILFAIANRWKPLFVFSMTSFKSLFNFGSKLLGAAILNTIYLNMYSLVIGRYYSATDVGYYNRAYSFSQFVSYNITGIITRTSYPLQCKMQNENELLIASLTKYIRFSTLIIFFLSLLLAAISRPFILFVLTEKWIRISNLLPILCIAYMWFPLGTLNNLMLYVKNKTQYALQSEIIKKIIAVIILVITLPLGLKALCWGLLIYNIIDYIITMHFVKKVLPLKVSEQLKSILPCFITSIISYGITTLFLSLVKITPFIDLIMGGFLYTIIFFCIAIILKIKEITFFINKISLIIRS